MGKISRIKSADVVKNTLYLHLAWANTKPTFIANVSLKQLKFPNAPNNEQTWWFKEWKM